MAKIDLSPGPSFLAVLNRFFGGFVWIANEVAKIWL